MLRRWESAVEQQIRAGMARGEFDQLPGKGQPIAGLDSAADTVRDVIKVALSHLEMSGTADASAFRLWLRTGGSGSSGSSSSASGIRVGTPAITSRGLKEADMDTVGALIARALSTPDDEAALAVVREEVERLCRTFPLYPDSVV